ncbi:MAG: DUF2336 domain-containing protein [Xanthobacteraceae bacterium]
MNNAHQSNQQPSFAELEAALSLGLRPRRFELLRRVTDLFIANVDACSDDQISDFDEVMERLVEKIEREALIELSGRLAPLKRAPTNIVHRLSRDDDIEIAQPVLEQSVVLSETFLVEIAKTKSQAHLAAIAGRPSIPETLTDVLIDRGDLTVARKIAANQGARFSRFGHTRAANRAEQDFLLAEAFVGRSDVPADIFDQLIQKAAETVRQKLIAKAAPEMRERITRTVEAVSKNVARSEDPRPSRPQPHPVAGLKVALKPDTALLRGQVTRLAKGGKISELVDALASLFGVSNYVVKNLIRQQADETLVILGKAVGLGWPDINEILVVTMKEKFEQRANSKALFDTFASLSNTNAQRILQFVQTSRAASGADIKKMM